MPTVFARYATPFITGLFLVSLVSGLALFFHIGPSGFHGMHEWLSLVLILPFVLHIWKNWRPMLNYLRGRPMAVGLVASLVAAAVFLVPTGGTEAGGPPQFRLFAQVMKASPEALAPVLGQTPEAVTAALTAAGFTPAAGQSLSEIATAAGKTEADVAAALLAGGG
ncbi:DUF4405 domain-containing protein [Rhodobacter sp. Har01]|uniref:DUF4405 domain-containing protein n=1 Tax=Rhodobacter sp. Har01 TaxID=2883999 RepID=UPI001D073E75|nr:DUF4405 domain-containing protein [Rhodobacter sp. Har01]MCB6178338.1 DUF4405 domain-containing protein [Rhodobacter sp. Har01]